MRDEKRKIKKKEYMEVFDPYNGSYFMERENRYRSKILEAKAFGLTNKGFEELTNKDYKKLCIDWIDVAEEFKQRGIYPYSNNSDLKRDIIKKIKELKSDEFLAYQKCINWLCLDNFKFRSIPYSRRKNIEFIQRKCDSCNTVCEVICKW